MLLAACLGWFVLTLSAALAAGYRLWVRQPARAGAGDPREQLEFPGLPFVFTGWLEMLGRIGSLLPVPDAVRAQARRELISAGYRLPAFGPCYFGLKAFLTIAAPCLVCPALYAARPAAFPVAFAGALAAYIAFRSPAWGVGFVASRRRANIRRALPDLIDLLVIAIESGLSLDQGLGEAARGLAAAHPELVEELYLYQLELQAGTARAEALRNLGWRTAEPQVRKFGSLLIQTERFGTGISRVLRTQARYLRVRRRQQTEEQARQLSVKLIFPIFFLILPSTFLVTAGPAVLYLFGDLRKVLGVE